MLSLLHATNSPLNESNEKLRMKQWCLYFHSSFPIFQDYAVKAEICFGVTTIYLRRTKIKRTLNSWQETNKGDTGHRW